MGIAGPLFDKEGEFSAKELNKKPVNLKKLTGPAEVQKIAVASNNDSNNTVDLTGGLIRLLYYESLLSNTVRATYTYADAGDTTNNQKRGTNCKNTTTAVDGLPIVGEEKVNISFMDNRGNQLTLEMYVNKITNLDDESTKSVAQLDLVSKEFLINEKGDSRLEVCMEGKISQHIKTILTENLKTEKKLEIEETGATNYNFIGNRKKPFWSMNNLGTKAAPTGNKPGNTGGFLLYETAKGYYFKSLDKLLAQKKKKSAIYTESTEGEKIPKGYDLKVLEFVRDSSVNVQGKYQMGAYSTRCISFNPFSCEYNEKILSANLSGTQLGDDIAGNQEYLSLAGKEFWQSNSELDSKELNAAFTRTTWNITDTGTLPGGTTDQQIDNSKEQNFDLENIFNQSIQRYNQLFGQTTTITIAGDFSLHAGDAIFVDFPKLEADPKQEGDNKNSGGKYIISDLCHYVSSKETYTKLALVRDSMGRKGIAAERTATGSEIIQNKSTDRYRIDPGSI